MPLVLIKCPETGMAINTGRVAPGDCSPGAPTDPDLRVITPPLSQSLDPIGPHRVALSDQEKIKKKETKRRRKENKKNLKQ